MECPLFKMAEEGGWRGAGARQVASVWGGVGKGDRRSSLLCGRGGEVEGWGELEALGLSAPKGKELKAPGPEIALWERREELKLRRIAGYWA